MVGGPAWLVDVASVLGAATRDVASAFVAIVAVALLWRDHRRWAQWLLLSAALGYVVQTALKQLVDRPRPTWPDAALSLTTPSFPSGHAMTGIDTWVVLGVILLCAPVGGRLPRAVGAAAVAIGILLGPSRLVLGVHWPTDVLAGWLLGAAVALLAAAVVLSARARDRGGSAPRA